MSQPTFTMTLAIDLEQDATFDHAYSNLMPYVQSISSFFGTRGTYDKIAGPAMMTLTVRNDDGAFWVDNPSAKYYGLLRKNLLVRWQVTHDGTTHTLFIGKLKTLPLQGARYRDPASATVTLRCEDFVGDLYNAPYRPTLTQNVLVSDEITTMFKACPVVYPYEKSVWVLGYSTLGINTRLPDHTGWLSTETAQTTIPFTGDNKSTEFAGDATAGVFTYLEQLINAEMGFGLMFWWSPRTSKFYFRDRQYYLRNTSADLTLTGDEVLEGGTFTVLDEVYNVIRADYQPREVGAAGSVLWSNASTITLEQGESTTISANYSDPDNPNATIAGIDMLVPQATIDFEGNSESDGSGTDYTDLLDVVAVFYANSAEVTVTFDANARGTGAQLDLKQGEGLTCYVTSLQLRGTPLIIYDTQEVEVRDPASIAEHGLSYAPRVSLSLVSAQDTVESYIRTLLGYWAQTFIRVPRIDLATMLSDTIMSKALDYTVGDVVDLDLSAVTWISHTQEYVIVGEEHSFDAQTRDLTTSWNLMPLQRFRAWVLGVTGKSELGESTYLVF